MRNLLGVAFSLLAVGFVYAGVSARSRRLTERRVAGIPDGAEPASRMFAFGEIMRPIILFFLGYLGVKASFVYYAMDAQRYLSLFDLGGFLGALAAYAYWVHVRTKYLPAGMYEVADTPSAASSEPAANDAVARTSEPVSKAAA